MLHTKLAFVALMCWTFGFSDAQLGNLLAPVAGIIGGTENEQLCNLDTAGIISYYGYVPETHYVTTADGYILTVHCLSNATARNSSLNPVIAWHGLSDASHTFVINSLDQSLGFLLADRGYFVCLPNARGNTYSKGYTNSSRNSNIFYGSFWEFSWDQIAQFDVPAVIDAVLSWTGKSKVIYVGHSQGSTTMFALLSTQPSYNDKISIFAALAPVTFFSNSTGPSFKGASPFVSFFEGLYGYEFLNHTSLQTLATFIVCSLPTQALCANLMFFLFGYSSHLNEEKLPVFLCKSPSDYAWGQYTQYVQLAGVDAFQKYDFHWQNPMKYGQSSPPQYDLTKVRAPVALFHSGGDDMTADPDVQNLKSRLSNCVFEQHLDASLDFDHLDYIWAEDVREIVYDDLINLIQNY